MAQFSVNAQRFDPYKNFKFRVKWDGRYVTGVSKVSGLKRTTEVVKHRDGGDPGSTRKSPGRTEDEAITIERGVTYDTEFENWANQVWNFGVGLGAEVSLEDFHKDLILEVHNEAGQLALAYKLGLALYRVGLSAEVRKYIGETEKNLRKLLEGAEDGGATLLFDEADALFGKRSEVKDSHDRYANIDVNYVLQRPESRRLAAFATDRKAALDSAFLRRLRIVVNFPFPGVAERRAIWASMFPAQTAAAALDFDRLAQLPLTGGGIHGIARKAAFIAAKAGVPIGMPLLLAAVHAEYRKLGKPVNAADFRRLPGAAGAPDMGIVLRVQHLVLKQMLPGDEAAGRVRVALERELSDLSAAGMPRAGGSAPSPAETA